VTIEDIIQKQNIKELLHFTTNLGLLGILDSKALKSRARLRNDQRLEFILTLNTPTVKDPAWVDYVNLSVTRINITLYTISSGNWHPNLWWCVLAFDPIIMKHNGVYFTTTNNIYPSVRRGQGPVAFDAIFAPVVYGRYHIRIERALNMPASHTTCEQAEVLYPGELSTEFLRRVYVATDEDQDDVYGQIAAVSHPDIPVAVNPGMFGIARG
jgi:ssDNA thymidine ADP-ribosyltransferase DarT-like protein